MNLNSRETGGENDPTISRSTFLKAMGYGTAAVTIGALLLNQDENPVPYLEATGEALRNERQGIMQQREHHKDLSALLASIPTPGAGIPWSEYNHRVLAFNTDATEYNRRLEESGLVGQDGLEEIELIAYEESEARVK